MRAADPDENGNRYAIANSDERISAEQGSAAAGTSPAGLTRGFISWHEV
jgi:hypothetical protein